MYNTLQTLKRLNVDTEDAEDLVGYSMVARVARTEFETLGMEVPEWLDDVTRKLRREVHSRNADARANAIKQIDAELERMKEKPQKIADLQAKREKLLAAGM